MAEVRWIKIVTDIFDDEKILLIESMPDADALITIWFKLLCLAGKQNNSGVFILGQMPYTDEMFSTIFRRPLNTVRLAFSVFEQFGMVEIINNTVTIPNWDKHQSLDALEKKRAYQRELMQKRRAEQKALCASQVSEANCEANSETNSDANVSSLDKNKNKNKNKKKTISKDIDIFGEYAADKASTKIYSALVDFEEMRKSIKKPLTDQAKRNLISKLESEFFSNEERIKALNNSIDHCWLSVYPDKNAKKPISQSSEAYSDEDLERLERELGISKPKGDISGEIF